MSDSDPLAEKHARNRERRLEWIREWAEYVRTHPDEEWGRQVNELVDAQLQAARHAEAERSDRGDRPNRRDPPDREDQ